MFPFLLVCLLVFVLAFFSFFYCCWPRFVASPSLPLARTGSVGCCRAGGVGRPPESGQTTSWKSGHAPTNDFKEKEREGKEVGKGEREDRGGSSVQQPQSCVCTPQCASYPLRPFRTIDGSINLLSDVRDASCGDVFRVLGTSVSVTQRICSFYYRSAAK